MSSTKARVPAPRVEGIGEVSTGCVVWRTPDRYCATLVVKATFALVADGPMRRVASEPLVVDERNYDQSPVRSVKHTTDMALFTPKTDVVLTGHAEVPDGRWAPRLPVRLAVYRGDPILDKTLIVYGERPAGQPKPFQRMPLTYEKAYGGLGFPDNPFGAGKDGVKLPNIELPDNPKAAAGFGPIGRSWSARRNLLDPDVRKRVVAEFPEVSNEFDWSYFQSAPPDQQVPGIVGDEWIVLEGMSSAHARLQTCLPGICAEMFLHGADLIEPTPVGPTTFRADLVRIDADSALCSVTFRAVICTAEPEQLDVVRVMVGVAERDAPIAWPAAAAILARWEEEDAEFLDADDVDEIVSTSRIPFGRQPDHTITLSGLLPRNELPPPMPFAGAKVATTPKKAPAKGSAELSRTQTLSALGLIRPKDIAAALEAPSQDEEDAPPPTLALTPSDETLALPPAPKPAALPTFAPRMQSQFPRAGTIPTPTIASRTSDFPRALPRDHDDTVESAPTGQALVPMAPKLPQIGRKHDETLDVVAAGRSLPMSATPFAAIGPGVSSAANDPIPGAPWKAPPAGGRSPKLAPRIPPPPLERRTGPVPMAFEAPFSGTTFASDLRPPQPSLTVVVKGTFDLVPGGKARLRKESDPPVGEIHLGETFVSSVLYPSDLSPYKPKADVLLVGHAYPPDRRGKHAHVRFKFGKKEGAFDRKAAIVGDRFWDNGVPSNAATFAVMPLVFERAFGGVDSPGNPVGRGRGALPDGRIPMPNIENPDALLRKISDTPAPVAFCGIPMNWTSRWSKMGSYDEGSAVERWPHFPANLDWGFFQVAPPEQQVAVVEGDEPFLLAGVHPKVPVLEGELPHLSVRCFVQPTQASGGAFYEVLLRLDTVVFEPDHLKLHLVWRGFVEVTDDDAPEIESLFVTSRPLKEKPHSLAEAKAEYTKWKEENKAKEKAGGGKKRSPVAPVETAPVPEPKVEEVEAPPDSETQTKVDQHLQELRSKISALGVNLPPIDDAAGAAANVSPPSLDPETAFAKMKAGGVQDEVIAEMRATLKDLPPPDAEPETRAVPTTEEAKNGEEGRPTRKKVVEMLDAERSLDGLDFSGLDLSDLDFSGRSLKRTRFKDACLAGARFKAALLCEALLDKADLREADLTGADLTGADLTGADLRLAKFTEAVLTKANFATCQADGARFDRTRGAGARFVGASLAGATFAHADLNGVDLTRTALDDTSFENAVLPDVRLYEATGRRTSFKRAEILRARAEGASFEGGKFSGVKASGSIWDDAELSDSTFRGAGLGSASFVRARCEGSVLAEVDLTEGRLQKAKFSRATFHKAKLAGASFEGADLTQADLRGACLHKTETWRAKLKGVQTEGAILGGPLLGRRT